MGNKITVPCLIVGTSGSGKSSTFRNLDPKKTVIVNCERKILPFKGFGKFKNVNINKYKDYVQLIKELKAAGDKYDCVIIDSLTSLLEINDKYCRTVFSGYNIYSEYNNMVYDLLQDIKELPQQVFITGIPEYLEISPGEVKAVVKTVGKQWKGAIEKEFAIVLHTHLIDDEEGNILQYQLDTKPSKSTSAKAPDGMFNDRYISNDAKLIVEAIDGYYNS
jgi:hypothetical protein